MPNFIDKFSTQADIYLKYRPHYPEELFAFLSGLTHEHQLAWDCGTGNGQAAIGLASYYEKVIATDPSEQQLKHSMTHERVTYLNESAESNSIASNSIDLLTIANALHWFNFDEFYKESNRVLKPNGVIAAWCYCIPTIDEEVDQILNTYHYQTLDNYWVAQNRLVEKEYTTIPFPFKEIQSPPFQYQKLFSLDDLIGYLNTWSATQRYITENKVNPTDELAILLKKVWQNPTSQKLVTWKIALKVGMKI